MDIGQVGAADGAARDAGVWTVRGSGADISNRADASHVVRQELSGDVSIGQVLIGSSSPDGVAWTEIHRDAIAMDATVQVGLAVTSHRRGVLATATFSDVDIVTAPKAGS